MESCGVSPSSVIYGDSFPPGGSLSLTSLSLEEKVSRRVWSSEASGVDEVSVIAQENVENQKTQRSNRNPPCA